MKVETHEILVLGSGEVGKMHFVERVLRKADGAHRVALYRKNPARNIARPKQEHRLLGG